MRVLSVLLLMGVAMMLVSGCGPKKEDIPPLESTEMQAPVSPGPTTIDTNPGGIARTRTGMGTVPAGATVYTIQKGDTLYSLAKRFYGDGKLWTKIAEANKDKVRDISSIPVGTSIVIPPK